ncbi:MAG: glycosyltransferase family 39 protein [Anaerolineae bacterium]|nr:glycosyltransferase family 39 protein [Anaerolineae bacterium]
MSRQDGAATGRWHVALFVVCLCGFLFRLVALGRYVTPDEPAWVFRAIRFADALAAREWAAVPATGHPGVITMWLGAVGVMVQRLLAPAESAAHLEWIRHLAWLAPENGEAFRHLAFFLSWGRVAVALTTTVGLAVLYLLLGRLFGRRVALLLATILACDPFLIGHSGLLHTDALLTTFVVLALGAALNGWQEPHRLLWWALAGLFAGLALLTKLSAVVLFPFTLLLIVLAWGMRLAKVQRTAPLCSVAGRKVLPTIPRSQHAAPWAQHAAPLLVCVAVFLSCTLVVVWVLYPVFWSDVPAALKTLCAASERHVETAQHPIFFAGRMTYEPGPAFYPLVFLFRVSPVVLGGLVVGLVGLRHMRADRRRVFMILLVFALVFGVVIGMGAKKYDRYLLPAFPPLALAAVLGWERLGRRWPLLAPLVQCLIVLPCIPYPLAAFNPLLGGARGAAHVLEVGWGEEMGEAARWLNRLPGAESLSVATPSIPPFASLFKGRTLPIERATQADYVVQPLWPYRSITASDYITVSGFAKPVAIITNTAPLELAAYLEKQSGAYQLILLDAETPLLRQYRGPATIMSLAGASDPSAILARLNAVSFLPAALWLISDPAAAPLTRAHLRQVLESMAEEAWTATVAGSTVTFYWPRQVSEGIAFAYPKYRFGASSGCELALVDALLPEAPVNASFPVYLRWRATASNSCDFFASLYLVDSAGRPWAEVGHQVLNQVGFPTSAWLPGGTEWADTALVLPLPERILPGTYTVQLTLTNETGAQVGGWDAGGRFRGVRLPLGEVEVVPPPTPVGPVLCSEGRRLTAGPFRVCHYPVTVTPQGECSWALIWSALERPGADYRIRLRVLDATGAVVQEQVEALSPYPVSLWRAGDSFEVRYDLRLNPELPAADYVLVYNVLGPGGVPLWDTDESLAALTLPPRAREFALPEHMTCPVDLVLGDVVHLRGFDMAGYPAVTVAPGEVLTLTLYWQADGPTDLDYSVFVHLVGPDGRNHGQADYPAGGEIGVPSSGWATGQVIVDRVSLTVAPDAPGGSYRLAVGMYDVLTGVRLPVTEAGGLEVAEERAFLPVDIIVRVE